MSLAILEACGGVVHHNFPPCSDEIAAAFANRYKEPEDKNPDGTFKEPFGVPKLPDNDAWISPWFLWKQVANPKEDTQTADDTTAPHNADNDLVGGQTYVALLQDKEDDRDMHISEADKGGDECTGEGEGECEGEGEGEFHPDAEVTKDVEHGLKEQDTEELIESALDVGSIQPNGIDRTRRAAMPNSKFSGGDWET